LLLHTVVVLDVDVVATFIVFVRVVVILDVEVVATVATVVGGVVVVPLGNDCFGHRGQL
jgi:hypothetical protein